MNTTANRSPLFEQSRPAPADPVQAPPIPVDVRRHSAEAPADPGASIHRVRAAVQNAIHGDLATDLDRVRKLAGWMDARFSVAGFRFGFDGLIGLIPGVGDTVTALIALYPLAVARRHKLGRGVQAKILGNIAVDWVVGLVPLVGDLFDVGYKGNTRNLRVIERAAERKGIIPPTADGVAGHPGDRR